LPEIKLVGLHVRTNNKAEMDPLTAKISPCVQQYFHQQWAEKIPHRTHPGRTFCAYTNYESDYTGDYTFYIGEEVNSLEDIPEGLESHIIPPQTYINFITQPGPMPTVLINAWQDIWKMSSENLSGERSYHTDFEVYDERASDPQNTILDIYIGIK
jgi:predicted transcriptional regulator YdeE